MKIENPDTAEFNPISITRPSPKLMAYYFVSALFLGPFFLVAIIPLYFRYRTMRFTFDVDGITLKYGVLFQREKRLNYRRIQDIHMTRGVIQRRFGLATISLYSASGKAGPEMSLEGILNPNAMRDYLYVQSRRAREGTSGPDELCDTSGDEVTALLREIRDALVTIGKKPE